jgi:protocatechuate 3,4-dioxygenase beta subunit
MEAMKGRENFATISVQSLHPGITGRCYFYPEPEILPNQNRQRFAYKEASTMQKEPFPKTGLNRRAFLRNGAATTAGLLLTACVGATPTGQSPTPTNAPVIVESPSTVTPEPTAISPAAVETVPTAPTPECVDLDDTLAQTAGPYYTPNTPQRQSLREEGMAGTPLVVTGRVVNNDCSPVAGAVLDFWHADNDGQYDNSGYRLRGHQFADEQGNYQLETIVPGLYPGRTRHIHVIVQGQNTRRLTTQLYWPNEPQNARDRIFHPALVMQVAKNGEGQVAIFDFVL